MTITAGADGDPKRAVQDGEGVGEGLGDGDAEQRNGRPPRRSPGPKQWHCASR